MAATSPSPAYVAATLLVGFLFVRLGISLERRPEPAS